MRKTDISVQELVDMIERGELRLPEMQRQFVWKTTRVRDLLDSLYRGYPSGSILVWETDEPMPARELAVSQKQSPFAGHKLLLDGQQRLTSLSAVIRGEPVKVRNRKRPIDILFNLEHPEELVEVTEVDDGSEPSEDGEGPESSDRIELLGSKLAFVVASRNLAALPNWVSVTEVFHSASNAPFLKKAGVATFEDPRYDKYNQRLERLRGIRQYQFSMQVLERNLTYVEVTEIFVRVNSLGAKLRGSDLALAQITAKWRTSLKLFEEFHDELAGSGFTLSLGVIVRALVAFATGYGHFRTVAGVPPEQLQEAWQRVTKAIRFAVDFLRENAGIDSPVLLSSPLFAVTFAYLADRKGYQLSRDEERQILLWLHIANGRGYYSGSMETTLTQDLSTIRQSADPQKLLDSLRVAVGRLEFEPNDFAGKNQINPLFKLVFLTLKARGAKDWQNGLAISVSHRGKNHSLQFHHIHPKATLKGQHPDRDINEIANFAFLCGTTNRHLGKKPPEDYLPDIVAKRGEEALTSQSVPLDRALWQTAQYAGFLRQRRGLLAEAVNSFLNGLRTAAVDGSDRSPGLDRAADGNSGPDSDRR